MVKQSVITTTPRTSNLETPAMSAYRSLLLRGVPENLAAAHVLAEHRSQPSSASVERIVHAPSPMPAGNRAA